MEDRSQTLTADALLTSSSLYREFLAEREEILKHKWIESQKAGCDIGFERALTEWITNHRARWRAGRMNPPKDDEASPPTESEDAASPKNRNREDSRATDDDDTP